MENNKFVILSIVAVLVLACAAVGLIGYRQVIQDNPNFWQEFQARQSDQQYQAQLRAESQADTDEALPYAAGALVLFIVFLFGGNVAKAVGTPLLILIGGVVVLFAIAYFFGWSDKTQDGTPDVMVVPMVAPSGNDAVNDKAYADVNTTNADATMKNSASLVMVWVAFGIVIFIIGLVSQFFRKEW